MKTVALLCTGLFFLSISGFSAEPNADEKALRDMVRQQSEGKNVITYTGEAIFVSGLYPRPMIGKARSEQEKALAEQTKESRPNQTTKFDIVRLVVSKSGDMAEEFGNFKIEFDGQGNQRTGFEGSYLRVWQKVNGTWK